MMPLGAFSRSDMGGGFRSSGYGAWTSGAGIPEVTGDLRIDVTHGRHGALAYFDYPMLWADNEASTTNNSLLVTATLSADYYWRPTLTTANKQLLWNSLAASAWFDLTYLADGTRFADEPGSVTRLNDRQIQIDLTPQTKVALSINSPSAGHSDLEMSFTVSTTNSPDAELVYNVADDTLAAGAFSSHSSYTVGFGGTNFTSAPGALPLYYSASINGSSGLFTDPNLDTVYIDGSPETPSDYMFFEFVLNSASGFSPIGSGTIDSGYPHLDWMLSGAGTWALYADGMGSTLVGGDNADWHDKRLIEIPGPSFDWNYQSYSGPWYIATNAWPTAYMSFFGDMNTITVRLAKFETGVLSPTDTKLEFIRTGL